MNGENAYMSIYKVAGCKGEIHTGTLPSRDAKTIDTSCKPSATKCISIE